MSSFAWIFSQSHPFQWPVMTSQSHFQLSLFSPHCGVRQCPVREDNSVIIFSTQDVDLFSQKISYTKRGASLNPEHHFLSIHYSSVGSPPNHLNYAFTTDYKVKVKPSVTLSYYNFLWRNSEYKQFRKQITYIKVLEAGRFWYEYLNYKNLIW